MKRDMRVHIVIQHEQQEKVKVYRVFHSWIFVIFLFHSFYLSFCMFVSMFDVKFFAAVILHDLVVLDKYEIYTKLPYDDLGLKSRY